MAKPDYDVVHAKTQDKRLFTIVRIDDGDKIREELVETNCRLCRIEKCHTRCKGELQEAIKKRSYRITYIEPKIA